MEQFRVTGRKHTSGVLSSASEADLGDADCSGGAGLVRRSSRSFRKLTGPKDSQVASCDEHVMRLKCGAEC